ncbi:MAG: enoyl-CoA hydratase/isomerase family protein, partial [Candidatus Poseidoniaceae archaeon]|nr:enoyl-CoA hydratase/isomerase family protein [Candidatus Poseidoniaceae archaeon]
MSDLYGLTFEPMPNRLVNYGTTDNGIAVIELASDSAGAPLEGDAMGPNTYTHGMMCDIDTAIIKARFDDDVTVIVITGNGSKFFSAGASIQMLNSVTPGFKYNFCLHANETLSRFEQTTKLVICAMNGHAVGGGLEI